jgi:Uma2 family endonuclease
MIATAPRIFPGIAFQMPNGGMTDEQFYQFCVLNHELRIERTADKYIVVMPPTNSDTGHRNFNLTVKFGIWNETTKLGKGFDSSTGFKLPNGAERAPDLAWIRNERWAQINEVQRKRFAPICPDFVVEIRSGDQNMTALKQKMEEYMTCGCRLGWLVDPQHRETRVYFENGDIHTVPFADLLSGGDVLPGFSLRMADIWAD